MCFGVFNVCIKLLEGFFLFCCEEKRKKPSEKKRNAQSFTTAFGCFIKAGKPALKRFYEVKHTFMPEGH